MRSRVSAGIVLYRIRNGLEIFIELPGGPFFAHKDDGHWSIPKGEVEPDEDLLATAIREFEEEVGLALDPKSEFIPLGNIQQKGGKIVHGWAVRGDWPAEHPVQSNTFTIEWPPRSGVMKEFPEVDRAQFFPVAEAKRKLKATQIPLIERLEEALRIE